jgi:hypothetical protein
LLTADSATIAMVVQDTSNRRYTLGSLPQPRAVISKGMGSVMLSDTFTIPMLATPVDGLSEVTVHFPLSLPGALQTSLVATASYPLQ